MAVIKRTGIKSAEVKTGFEAYDGPEPDKRGIYRGKINSIKVKEFRTGSQGYAIGITLEAAKGDPKGHAKFDGFPIFTNLIFGDKEMMIARESNFYAAIGVKDGPAIEHEEGDLSSGVKVTKIGGKNPVGAIVNADIKIGSYEGAERPEVDGIYKFREVKVEDSVDEEDDDLMDDVDDEEEDLLEESDEPEDEEEDDEVEEEASEEERLDELKGAKIAELRKLAQEDYDLDTSGLKKAELVDLIINHEFGAEDDTPAALDDELDEDEIEEEEEELEEEEEEEDDSDARREELEGMTRSQLKKVLSSVSPETKVYKSTTDDALREAILEAESEDETPF